MSLRLGLFRAVQCVTVALFPFSVDAQLLRESSDGEEWKELEIRLPKFPKPENLIATHVSGLAGFTFLVDSQSIDIGRDGVVRFVVVARSPGGAENISFEGIRCSTRERKLYAVGRENGTWFSPKVPEWVNFQASRVNSYHDSFARQYFCIERTPVLNSAKALEFLRKR
jgi:CNP1-like family